MLKIGITGGIATGKTFVCTLFKKFNIPIYNADQAAKDLVESDKKLKEKIIGAFGSESYTPTGSYNVAFIRKIIFHDEKAKKTINRIIHPAVLKDSQEWFNKKQLQNFPYAIKEAALLFESKSNVDLDKIIVVHAPLELRVQRLMLRDHINESEALLKINSQQSQDEKVKLADYVITNDGLHPVIIQVYKLHHLLLQLSSDHIAL
ncbi:MAG: dephospho-CoA kinase [Saprospiraceae bacterium]